MYWELQEKKRSNRANESLTDYSNVTGRTEVGNKLTLGTEANRIQNKSVDNQFIIGNRQQDANAIQAEAARSRAETEADKIPILQLQADQAAVANEIRRVEAAIKSTEANIKQQEANTNKRRAGTYQDMANTAQFEADTGRQRQIQDWEIGQQNANTAFYNAQTARQVQAQDWELGLKNLDARWRDLDQQLSKLKLEAKDLDSLIERRTFQNVRDAGGLVTDAAKSIFPFFGQSAGNAVNTLDEVWKGK